MFSKFISGIEEVINILVGNIYSNNLYPTTDWNKTIGKIKISVIQNDVKILFRFLSKLNFFLFLRYMRDGIKLIIQIKIALFAGEIIIIPFWSIFLYKVK